MFKQANIGESSRSLYERSKEHVRDKDSREMDSHMVKHWLVDHREMSSPPKFKFKLLGSYQDPMTRQLAEAVRIEKVGAGILNSKSEYSRCRVPRLRIDMEGWARLKEDQASGAIRENVVLEEEANKDLEEVEDEERRLERKRGAEKEVEIEESRPRKKRKTKFPRLEAWGECKEQEQEVDTIITIQDYVHREGQVGSRLDTTLVPPKPAQDQWLDMETNTMLARSLKLQEKKKSISEDVKKKKFKFNTRGKLSKAEMNEIRRTHKNNIFSWVASERSKVLEMNNFEEMSSQVDSEVQREMQEAEPDMYKEDRLQRV